MCRYIELYVTEYHKNRTYMNVNTLNFSHRFTLFAFKTNDNDATIPLEMND